MSLTNALDFEDLVPGENIVYGYEFNAEGIPQSFTTQENFERIPGGLHPTHRGPFRYLVGPISANPAENRNGFKTYQIRGDGTFVEIAMPQNAVAAAAAAHVEIGPRMPIGTLAQSVRGASWGSILSSLVTGRLIQTDEMRELLDIMRELDKALKDQRDVSGRMGHGHGGSFAETQAAADRIRELNDSRTQIDDRLAELYREQYMRYRHDGGRLGILAACFGQNDSTFIESRIRTLQREIDTIRAEHFSSYLNFGAGPPPEETEAMGRRISELREQITALQQQLAALPREEGVGCTVSRKSRRRRNARRRRSRATRRR